MILEFNNIQPKISEDSYIAPNASVIGDVVIERGASIWFTAVLRGDVEKITIGENSNIQDNVSVHTSEHLPVVIGRGVTIGHNAVIHSCEIGDNTLIGMGAVVLDGAKIGKNCIIGAGALVRGGMEVPHGSMVLGMPAVVKRSLREEEISTNIANAAEYVRLTQIYKGQSKLFNV